jgi:uncharacterized membrane protein
MQYKKIFFFWLILSILWPGTILAQNNENAAEDTMFQAQVIEIIDEKTVKDEFGPEIIQQDLRLKILSESDSGQEIIYHGIDDFQVISQNYYQIGDKVLISKSISIDGEVFYDVIDYVRTSVLWWLLGLFAILTILIARFKGVKALISLFFSIFIIIKWIIPQILAGTNPLLVIIIGAILILLFIIYFTEGWNKKSHLAIISISITLLLTGVIAILFNNLAKLTGLANEEAMILVGLTETAINFQGLLLAGIILGTLGVLDDVVISQISAVDEIKKVNSTLSAKQLYKSSINIGKSHLSSMINTLFLAYAGVSLPLLILFSIKSGPWLSWAHIVNHEIIATEIIRTLIGSIGLLLAVPIATFLAVRFLSDTK